MKTEAHKRITEHTIQQFLDSMNGPFLTALHHEKQRIIDATEAEDLWYKNPERPFHWHFYRPDNVDIPDHFRMIFRFTLFSHEALDRHIIRLRENFDYLKTLPRENEAEKRCFYKEHKKLSRAVGGLLHHIQDMSTPSHVVPVFHGPAAPGGFKYAKDHFEDFAEEHIGEQLRDRHNWLVSEDDIKNSTPVESYEQLYKNTARETLTYLKGATFMIPIPDGEGLTMGSTAFWEHYDFISNPKDGKKTAGFGSYGPLENCYERYVAACLATNCRSQLD